MAKTRIPLNKEWEAQRRRDRLLQSHVAELGLDVRTANTLEEHGVFFISDLVRHREEDLLQFKNLGGATLDRLRIALLRNGLAFKT